MAEEPIYSFTTHEFEHQPKGTGWYFTATVIALIFIAYFYYVFRDIFGIITIAILAGLTMYFASQQPKEIEVHIGEKGISVGNVYFSYNTLKRFWIAEHGITPELHLETTAYLNKYVTLLLREEDREQVVEVLSNFIPETEPEPESLTQKIARRVRF